MSQQKETRLSRLVAYLGVLGLVAGLVVYAATVQAQEHFEGEVAYRIDLESLDPRIPVEYLRSQFGSSFVMVFKKGDYKQVFEGGVVDSVWYSSAENIEYTLMVGEQFLRVADGADPVLQVEGVEHPERTRRITARDASAMVIRFADQSKTTFWYVPEVSVNPDWFAEFNMVGFSLFYQNAKALFLGYDRELSTHRRSYTATALSMRAVSSSELALPDLPRKPFDFDQQ